MTGPGNPSLVDSATKPAELRMKMNDHNKNHNRTFSVCHLLIQIGLDFFRGIGRLNPFWVPSTPKFSSTHSLV